MPVMRKCDSGAVIFDLTPDEQIVRDSAEDFKALNEELKTKTALLDEKLKELDEAIKSAKSNK